ncbi:hypothetical protein IWX90DRAFT_420205 [Phyllosticta citrichinensis]|uniref:RRM domain-containing protein n=1 Tax=Phyllosticta citrichinensis TaxID=1130410 RepID=A0ABR1Y5H0_9PEZI
MAPEKTNKKRKSGASIPSTSTKKIKKTEAPVAEKTAAAKPSKAKAAAPKTDTAASSKPSRKRASDFFEAVEPATEKAEVEAEKATKKSNKKRKSEPEPEPEPESEESAAAEEAQESAEESENEKEDDQTAALLKGFESSEDEADGEDEGLNADEVPTIPNEKKLRKKLTKAQEQGQDLPGVVYVGRVPHGFYEHQMRAYFSQFGEITRLRLSRNKKTGRSKHYAFIEFKHASVARITAETMDKYLMFGHILQVRYIPADQVHPELFKGANRRFKPAPRNKMEGRHLRLGMEREGWDNRIKKEEQRRKEKEEKLKALGYEFEAPAVKGVDAVGKKEALPAVVVPRAIAEEPHQEIEVVKTVKSEPSKGTVTEKATRRSKRISSGAVEEKVEEVKETKPVEKKTKAKSKPDEEVKATKGKTEKEAKAGKAKDTKSPKAKKSKASK